MTEARAAAAEDRVAEGVRPRGVLVITVDRLPAWILPAYGATWVGAPTIDALAGAGVTFDRVILSDADPRRAIADVGGGSGAASLLAVGRSLGWRAAVVTDDPEVAPDADGVERIVVEPRVGDACAAEAAETNLGRLFATAAGVLQRGGHELVWCHVGSLGLAWDAPDEFRHAYVDPDDPAPAAGAAVPGFVVSDATDPDLVMGCRQVYAGQVTLLDHCLAPLMHQLLPSAAGAPTGWTMLFAGARGMPLGMHGRVGAGPMPPYGELVHVPAIIVDARGRMAAQRYGGLVTPGDLGRTLVSLVGAMGEPPPAGPRQERELSGLFRGWSAPVRDRVIAMSDAGTAVATAAWHFVLPRPTDDEGCRRGRLFAKPDDAFELCDVADRCPGVAEELSRIAEAAEAGAEERAWQEPLAAAAHGPA